MDEIIIENKLFHFIEYLKDIGLLTKFNVIYFKKIFYSIWNNKKLKIPNSNFNSSNIKLISDYLSKHFPEVILLFFKSISQQNKKSIAINIFQKYLNNDKNIICNKLLNLILIYYNNNIRNYFNKWFLYINKYKNKYNLSSLINKINDKNNKFNIVNLKNNNFARNNNNKYLYSNKEYTSFGHDNNVIINPLRNNNCYTFKNSLTSELNEKNLLLYEYRDKNEDFKLNNEKEQKNINEALKIREKNNLNKKNEFDNNSSSKKIIERNKTMYSTPKFNTKSKNNKIKYNNNAIERLYKDNEKRMEKREEETKKYDINNLKDLTFQPKLFSCKYKEMNKNNHIQRIQIFNQKKEENILKLSQNLENEFNKQYTFTPNINKNKYYSEPKNNNSLTPIHQRLYQDNKERQKRLQKKIQKSNDEIKKRANLFLINNDNNIDDDLYYINDNDYYLTYKYNTKNEKKKKKNKKEKSVKNVNIDYLHDLFDDYKKKEEKLNLKKIEIDKELGITFKPKLNNNKHFNKINQDFRENHYLIKHRNNIKTNKDYSEQRSGSYIKKNNFINKKREENFKDNENKPHKEKDDKFNTKKDDNIKNNILNNNNNNELMNVNKNIINSD